MKKFLIAATASLLIGAVAAHADVVTGTYTLSYQATDGNGPGLPGDLGSYNHGTGVYSFTENNLSVGTATSPANFFTADPNNLSGLKCTSGRSGKTCTDGDIVNGIITVNFSINTPEGTQTISDTGAYTADYFTNPKSDSITWTTETLVVPYSTLDDLDITLYNASDWDITPKISFEIVDAPPSPTNTPEPGSLALLGTALLGFLGVTAYRRRAA